MEFWYKHNRGGKPKNYDIRLYQDGDGDGGVWADRHSSDGSVLTYFVNEFSNPAEADAYLNSIRHEKLTEAHAEALAMNAERTLRHTSTEYAVEVTGEINDYITCDNLQSAMELADLLRKKQGYAVRVVKRATITEVVG